MRLDQILPLLGVIKRRTVAKQMADNGLISINNAAAKAGKGVNVGDTIHIGGTNPQTIKVLQLPGKSLSKEQRQDYYEVL